MLIALALGAMAIAGAARAADAERGRYLFTAAGCAGCHTDTKSKGPLLAGGRALKTPFGIFYGPNITPHRVDGIGGWSDADFIRAMRRGVAPDGRHYYPVFPFTSFAAMTTRDLLDLKAYLFTLPAIARPSRAHRLRFPFGFRLLMIPWKWLFFRTVPLRPDPAREPAWNRGAYLVRALSHCGECHTPRAFLGAAKGGMEMAGNREGPEGEPVPNITPDRATGIGAWSAAEIVDLLKDGMLPDGDFTGGAMAEVVDGTSRLSAGDLRAIATYLKSLPPIPSRPGAKR